MTKSTAREKNTFEKIQHPFIMINREQENRNRVQLSRLGTERVLKPYLSFGVHILCPKIEYFI